MVLGMGDGVSIMFMGLVMCFVGLSTLLSARLGVWMGGTDFGEDYDWDPRKTNLNVYCTWVLWFKKMATENT